MLEVSEKTHLDRVSPKMPKTMKMMSGLTCTSCKNHIALFESRLDNYLKNHNCKKVTIHIRDIDDESLIKGVSAS